MRASYALVWSLAVLTAGVCPGSAERTPIRSVFIPLADHYAVLVAYEKYRGDMEHADFRIEGVRNPRESRALFLSGEVDLAFNVCPMAMDMFRESPNFRWVSLVHRDGNALVINDIMNSYAQLPTDVRSRVPDERVAQALARIRQETGRPSQVGIPDPLATHAVVLYRYLKDHGQRLDVHRSHTADVVARRVAPPASPAFLRRKSGRGEPAAFEQSLPWPDLVETNAAGLIAWYSKDVIVWPQGHVECIAIATDACIASKPDALREVIAYIHKAGLDIERARRQGGAAMAEIVTLIRRHIPEHTEAAIRNSLRIDLNAINYRNLNVDREGLRVIMDLAIEAGFLQAGIDIDAFADDRFATEITESDLGLPATDVENSDE